METFALVLQSAVLLWFTVGIISAVLAMIKLVCKKDPLSVIAGGFILMIFLGPVGLVKIIQHLKENPKG